MNKFAKKLTAFALSGSLLLSSAGAVTMSGDSETWFDQVLDVVRAMGLNGQSTEYAVQNLVNQYLKDHPEEQEAVFNAVLSQLDTHSMYLSTEEYAQGFSTLTGYVGIGVGVSDTLGGVEVREVTKYSAAEEAGFQIGDLFLTVDGEDVTGLDKAALAERLRGEEGSTVVITVRRLGQELTLTCVRQQINHVYVTNQTLAEGVEYIRIAAIGSTADWDAFSEIWEGLDDKNTRSVILDLRSNGGGVVEVAMEMLNAMTPAAGQKLATLHWREDKGGSEQTLSEGGGLPLNKIVVLVDGNTASAAELLAGSLRDVNHAVLLGSKTYGKGQGQYHLPLQNGDQLVLTVMEMELPKTGRYEGIGLKPDLLVENQMVTVNMADLQPLDTTETLYYGASSAAVYAMTERLSLLGLLDGAREVYDGDTVDAVNSFLNTYNLPQAAYASPAMLTALEQAMTTLDGESYVVDTQLQSALAIAKLAAQKEQQYTALPDGSWTTKQIK